MEKSGKSTLEIDLNQVVENYNTIKSKVAEDIDVAAVVKANSYGLGAKQISKKLYSIGCRSFYVIYLEEALEIKNELAGAKIYVLNGVQKASMETIHRNGFIPVLNDLYQIELWNGYAKKLGKYLPAAIMVDTGMTRLGLSEHSVTRIAQNPDFTDYLDIEYILSHLACASKESHPLNRKQLEMFSNSMKLLEYEKGSLCNSSGVLLGKEFHFNQVRPGCSLYGINPMDDGSSIFKQVATLKAEVVQIHNIKSDLPVSYNSTYIAKKGDRIATLLCGYADGYSRQLSNKGKAFYKGYKLPVVGTVTMDYIMVDATAVPEGLLSEMNYVELLGANVTVDEVAKLANSIGYEVLTSLGKGRFNKVYKG